MVKKIEATTTKVSANSKKPIKIYYFDHFFFFFFFGCLKKAHYHICIIDIIIMMITLKKFVYLPRMVLSLLLFFAIIQIDLLESFLIVL